MIGQLMKVVHDQEALIKTQSMIIDEFFIIISNKLDPEELAGLEPLLYSVKDIAERSNI